MKPKNINIKLNLYVLKESMEVRMLFRISRRFEQGLKDVANDIFERFDQFIFFVNITTEINTVKIDTLATVLPQDSFRVSGQIRGLTISEEFGSSKHCWATTLHDRWPIWLIDPIR